MNRFLSLYRSSIGKKIVMAVTGFLLVLFVFIHMLGNLKIYAGPTEGHYKIDVYGEWLREMGYPVLGHEQGLWIFRIGLLVLAVLHVWSALAVWRMSRAARPVDYRKRESVASTWGSRTMRVGGLILLAFIVFHILHFTTGTIDPSGTFRHGEVHANMVAGFEVWWVSLFYIVAMIFLGLHLYHGIWSAFQTLGVANPRHKHWRRSLAVAVAVIVTLGNISIPLAILFGIVTHS
jgi:succinate dehydrogenase / fumarate reductase cytochrome b subunit